jgi:cytochrome P450
LEPIDLDNFADLRLDPLALFLTLQKEYGDIVLVRDETVTWYLVTHPDDVKRVLKDRGHQYRKNSTLKPLLGEGLLTGQGETWSKQRRMAQPSLQRPQIESRLGHITTATALMIERWQAVRERGDEIDLEREMAILMIEIVGEALFDVDLAGRSSVIDQAITTALDRLAGGEHRALAPAAASSLPAVGEIVEEILDLRHCRGNVHENDLLGTLLAHRSRAELGDRELRDMVLTLLFTGYETCSSLLAWTWYLLAGAPAVERQLRRELNDVLGGRPPAVGDLPRLELMGRVISEAMRLFPPVWCIARQPVADDELGGYPIPADALVLLSPYVTHRHQRFWENAESFDPDRFTPQRSDGRHRFAYFPFGAGPRQCIAYQLAIMEAQVILAMVANEYSMRLSPGRMVEPQPASTLHSRQGIWVTLHARPER